MLHPRVGGDDEISRKPRTEKHRQGCEPVSTWAEPPFSKKEKPEEGRFEKERKDALHGERLADHTASHSRELRPIGAKLKLHGNARHYAQREADAENFRPEARGMIPALVARAQ